jgi:hypothetical protein
MGTTLQQIYKFPSGLRIRITLMQIRILLLIKVMRIYDHWSRDLTVPLFSSLHAIIKDRESNLTVKEVCGVV